MYNAKQLNRLENFFSKEEFETFYLTCKRDGMMESEIANKLETDLNTLRVIKEIHGIKTIVRRRNKRGVTEEDFRKGESIGLDRRLILRRVGEGVPISVAISTPRQNKMIRHRRKRK